MYTLEFVRARTGFNFGFPIPARAGTGFWPVFPARTEQKKKMEQDFD
jgi:hypothetical protein